MRAARDWQTCERAKQPSVGQLLFAAARLLDEHAVARVTRHEPKLPLRPAHTSLFPHIDRGGTRLTELARRLGISKQAIGQLVSDLEALAVLERVEDPKDGRAKLVRFTDKGQAALECSLSVLHGLESELERRLGQERTRELHRALLDIVDELTPAESA